MVAVAAHKKQERIKREIEERERAQRQARYEELQRQGEIEQARRSLLEELASDWTKSNEIRTFLLQVTRKAVECGADANENLVGWLKWAQAHADSPDPLAAGVDHILKGRAEAEPEEPEKALSTGGGRAFVLLGHL
jgi:hypothetical protein